MDDVLDHGDRAECMSEAIVFGKPVYCLLPQNHEASHPMHSGYLIQNDSIKEFQWETEPA
jgi:hypothetical protein